MSDNIIPMTPTESIIIEHDIERLDYPVGENIVTNIPLIKQMIEAFKSVEEFKNRSINLICRGSSGAIIAALFASELTGKVKIIHIKKDGEQSHSDQCPKPLQSGLNVIVDDWVATGKTINEIYRVYKAHEYKEIDVVCVTGRVVDGDFKFIPRYILCSDYGK